MYITTKSKLLIGFLVIAILAYLLFIRRTNFFEQGSEFGLYSVSEPDEELNEAIERAQETIHIFKEYLKNPKSNQDFSLKAKFGYGNEVEHIWLDNIDFDKDYFYGSIANDPIYVKNIKPRKTEQS